MFMEKRHSIFLISFFLTLLSSVAISQDKFSELDEIEVTATRLDSTLLRSSRSVSVVGKDEIQNATQL